MKEDKKKGSPLFTITCVCYNSAKVIGKTLESVLDQSFTDFELLIVDGASTDNTLEVVNHYEKQLKKKGIVCRIYSEKDNGIYDAMNKAIDLANGQFIIYLNSDDHFNNLNVLKKTAEWMNQGSSCSVYYGDVLYDDKERYGGAFNSFRLSRQNICHQGIFYPLQCLKEKKFQLKYVTKADYATNLALWKEHSFEYLTFIVANCSGGGFSHIVVDKAFEEDRLLLIKLNLGYGAFIYKTIRSFLSGMVKYFSSKK